MVTVNSVGDLVLTDPEAMRALADPDRLALLDCVRREGPATTVELASHLEVEESSVRRDLGVLETFGLVQRDPGSGEPRWCAVAKGLVFEIPDDPDGQAAARQLSNVMFLQYVDLPKRWVAQDEPRLEPDWVRAAGLVNARVKVTPDELRGLQEGLERLLEPFTARSPGDVPAGARDARFLSYLMPEAP
jgi:DNA-binding transcriptional ArsR family regulator